MCRKIMNRFALLLLLTAAVALMTAGCGKKRILPGQDSPRGRDGTFRGGKRKYGRPEDNAGASIGG